MNIEKKKNKLPGLLGNSIKQKSERDSCSTDDEETNHLISSSSSSTVDSVVKRKNSFGRLLKRETSGGSKTSENTDYEQLKEAAASSSSLLVKKASSPSLKKKKKVIEEEIARLEQEFLTTANERLNAHEKRVTILEARLKKQDEMIVNLLDQVKEFRIALAQQQQQYNSSESSGCMSFDWFS